MTVQSGSYAGQGIEAAMLTVDDETSLGYFRAPSHSHLHSHLHSYLHSHSQLHAHPRSHPHSTHTSGSCIWIVELTQGPRPTYKGFSDPFLEHKTPSLFKSFLFLPLSNRPVFSDKVGPAGSLCSSRPRFSRSHQYPGTFMMSIFQVDGFQIESDARTKP